MLYAYVELSGEDGLTLTYVLTGVRDKMVKHCLILSLPTQILVQLQVALVQGEELEGR